MRARYSTIGLFMAALLVTASATAHHSPLAVFDMVNPVEMTAVLTEVRWVNPHIRLYFDPVDKEAFPEPWTFESQPPQWYRRVGISRTVFEDAIGQTVAVSGRPARSGEPFGFLMRITFEDGTSFQMVTDRGENVE